MTRVLKKNGAVDAPGVHSLASAWAPLEAGPAQAPVVDPELLGLRADVEALTAQLAERDARLAELRAEAEAAFKKGEAAGRDAGLREAEDGNEKRLARLEAGIGQAQATFEDALAGLERLAPALAHEALAALLGQGDERPQLVAAVVRHQVQTLEARSLIEIEVSASDFPDDEAVAGLQGSLGSLGPIIHASVSLKSGDCRIRLKLGTLDVGLDRQWAELAGLLRDMSEGGAI
jgi:flagellar biosynthesis/type III secretory pathway protein FliH